MECKKEPTLRLNLQYFAEGEGEGGGEGAAQPEKVNPLLVDDPPATPEAPETPQELDFGGRKVNPNDPNALQSVHKDYSELNRTYQQTNQQLKQLEQMNQQYQQMLQAQQQQQPAQPEQPKFTDEDIDKFNEEYQDMLYDNPFKAEQWKLQHPVYQEMMSDHYAKMVEPKFEPIQKQYQQLQEREQWQSSINQVSNKYEDFGSYQDEIYNVIAESAKQGRQLGPQDLESAYFIAKGRSSSQFSNPEQLLNNPEFVQKYILGNENIQKQVLSNYSQRKQDVNNNTPNLMANQPGGQYTALGDEKPKDIREASKAAMEWWAKS